MRTIKNIMATLTFADKLSNVDKVIKGQYEKLVYNSITTSYRKFSKKTQDKINKQGKNILKNREVIKRMFINGKQNCFIMLKDHKTIFQNSLTVRLLNPA